MSVTLLLDVPPTKQQYIFTGFNGFHVVLDDMNDEVEKILRKCHVKEIKKRRSRTTELCNKKISLRNSVMNFTSVQIPECILNYLRFGLKMVPSQRQNVETIKDDLILEAVYICKTLFKSYFDNFKRDFLVNLFFNFD